MSARDKRRSKADDFDFIAASLLKDTLSVPSHTPEKTKDVPCVTKNINTKPSTPNPSSKKHPPPQKASLPSTTSSAPSLSSTAPAFTPLTTSTTAAPTSSNPPIPATQAKEFAPITPSSSTMSSTASSTPSTRAFSAFSKAYSPIHPANATSPPLAASTKASEFHPKQHGKKPFGGNTSGGSGGTPATDKQVKHHPSSKGPASETNKKGNKDPQQVKKKPQPQPQPQLTASQKKKKKKNAVNSHDTQGVDASTTSSGPTTATTTTTTGEDKPSIAVSGQPPKALKNAKHQQNKAAAAATVAVAAVAAVNQPPKAVSASLIPSSPSESPSPPPSSSHTSHDKPVKGGKSTQRGSDHKQHKSVTLIDVEETIESMMPFSKARREELVQLFSAKNRSRYHSVYSDVKHLQSKMEDSLANANITSKRVQTRINETNRRIKSMVNQMIKILDRVAKRDELKREKEKKRKLARLQQLSPGLPITSSTPTGSTHKQGTTPSTTHSTGGANGNDPKEKQLTRKQLSRLRRKERMKERAMSAANTTHGTVTATTVTPTNASLDGHSGDASAHGSSNNGSTPHDGSHHPHPKEESNLDASVAEVDPRYYGFPSPSKFTIFGLPSWFTVLHLSDLIASKLHLVGEGCAVERVWVRPGTKSGILGIPDDPAVGFVVLNNEQFIPQFYKIFNKFVFTSIVPNTHQQKAYVLSVESPLNNYVPLLSSTLSMADVTPTDHSTKRTGDRDPHKHPSQPLPQPLHWMTTPTFASFFTNLVNSSKEVLRTVGPSYSASSESKRHEPVGSMAIVAELQKEEELLKQQQQQQNQKQPHNSGDAQHAAMAGLGYGFGLGLGVGRAVDIKDLSLPIIDQLIMKSKPAPQHQQQQQAQQAQQQQAQQTQQSQKRKGKRGKAITPATHPSKTVSASVCSSPTPPVSSTTPQQPQSEEPLPKSKRGKKREEKRAKQQHANTKGGAANGDTNNNNGHNTHSSNNNSNNSNNTSASGTIGDAPASAKPVSKRQLRKQRLKDASSKATTNGGNTISATTVHPPSNKDTSKPHPAPTTPTTTTHTNPSIGKPPKKNKNKYEKRQQKPPPQRSLSGSTVAPSVLKVAPSSGHSVVSARVASTTATNTSHGKPSEQQIPP